MQVYKLFLKILRSQLGQVIMYAGIFTSIITLISGNAADNGGSVYQAASMKIAILDNCDTKASREFAACITKDNQLIELDSYTKESIQDELFNRNIHALLTISEDFEEQLKSGNTDDLIDIYSIPGTFNSDIISGEVNGYISNVSTLLAAGFDVNSALTEASKINELHARTEILDNESSGKGLIYYFFSYIAYIMICIIFVSATPILLILNKKTIRSRISCSSYKLSQVNRETWLGLATLGIGICIMFSLLCLILTGSDLFSVRGTLFILNMVIYMILAIGLAFFVGQLITNENIVSMVANIIGLGFSFIGGVFVPLEFMGDGIKQVAHFLPSYWYINACENINSFKAGDSMNVILQCFGLEFLFAAVFFIAGGAVVKTRQGK